MSLWMIVSKKIEQLIGFDHYFLFYVFCYSIYWQFYMQPWIRKKSTDFIKLNLYSNKSSFKNTKVKIFQRINKPIIKGRNMTVFYFFFNLNQHTLNQYLIAKTQTIKNIIQNIVITIQPLVRKALKATLYQLIFNLIIHEMDEKINP